MLAAFVVCRGEHHPVYGIQSYTSWHYTDMVAHIRIHRAVPKIIDGMGRGVYVVNKAIRCVSVRGARAVFVA